MELFREMSVLKQEVKMTRKRFYEVLAVLLSVVCSENFLSEKRRLFGYKSGGSIDKVFEHL